MLYTAAQLLLGYLNKSQCVINLRGNQRFYAPLNGKTVEAIRKILDDPCIPDVLWGPDARRDAWDDKEIVFDRNQRV